ncbi:MAG: hypothetical protein NT154_06725 [Verrucomicrobia bacterium]|nr:hypothetical protein [Verrucomicrobiota bacterium]
MSKSRAVAASMTSVLKTLGWGLVSSGRRASARERPPLEVAEVGAGYDSAQGGGVGPGEAAGYYEAGYW